MLSAFNLEMDFTSDCYEMECYFETKVNISVLIAFVLIAFMAVIAFIFWIIYKRINLNVETNEFLVSTYIPADSVGTNGKAVENILGTLVGQRPLRPRRSLREL
jgi:hypothetical protein